MWNSKTQRNEEIVSLFRSGMPVQNIAYKYGLTRQRIKQIVSDHNATVDKETREAYKTDEDNKKVIYPNIRSWLLKQHMSISCFGRNVRSERDSVNLVYRLLQDPRAKIEVRTIKRILDTTGMTFEEAFSLPYLTDDGK